jgi:hypothetical protein
VQPPVEQNTTPKQQEPKKPPQQVPSKPSEKAKEVKVETPKKPAELPKVEERKSEQSIHSGHASTSPSDSPSTSSSPTVLSDENAPKNEGEEETWQEVKAKRNKKVTRQEESRRSRNRPHRSNANNDHHPQAGSTVDTRSERSVAVSVDGVEQPEEMTDSHVKKVTSMQQFM